MGAGAFDHRLFLCASSDSRPVGLLRRLSSFDEQGLVVLANEVALVLDGASPLASPDAISEEHSAVVGNLLAHRLTTVS
jgi:hypothetical protein